MSPDPNETPSVLHFAVNTTAILAMGEPALGLLTVLSDNPDLSAREILDWERQITDQEGKGDATTRQVYADWLRERRCPRREAQLRSEALLISHGGEVGRWEVKRYQLDDADLRIQTFRVEFERRRVLSAAAVRSLPIDSPIAQPESEGTQDG